MGIACWCEGNRRRTISQWKFGAGPRDAIEETQSGCGWRLLTALILEESNDSASTVSGVGTS